MRFVVLAAADSWYLADLRRAAAARHELAPLAFRDLASSLVEQKATVTAGKTDLREFDAVLVRTMPPGSLEQVVLRMDLLGELERQGVVVINPPRAIEAAVDKYLTSARLLAAGLRVPRTIACQTTEAALAAFKSFGGDVVLKPIFGGEGRGIARLTDEAIAGRVFRTLSEIGSVLYLQEFLPHHGFDVRVLVIGERMFAMRRRNPNDWRTNISRGATAEPCELPSEWAKLALRAAKAVGATVAGVDFLPVDDGPPYVLEVNAVPGWKALAGATRIDIAAEVLAFVERQLRDRKGFTERTSHTKSINMLDA